MGDEVKATLKDKMSSSKSTSYEALQYLQSFVARKKKSLGKDQTGQAVFYGANLLVDRNAHADVGELLAWFIDSDQFEVETGCDRIEALLKKMPSEDAKPVVTGIYDPLHKKVVTSMTKANQKDLQSRLLKLDAIFADVFQNNKLWSDAYKSVLRLGDIKRAAIILNEWSKGGFKHEKPLFFARAVITLLADKKLEQAAEMTACGESYIGSSDNIEPARAGEDDSAELAAWHLAIILSGLASMPPKDRVDKTRLFSVLATLYGTRLEQLDIKLLELLERVGKNVFAVRSSQPQSNPMALMQAMMQASAPRQQSQQQQKKAPMTKASLDAMLKSMGQM